MNPLFDSNGRRSVPTGLQANVCNPRTAFYLTQPDIDYAGRLNRLHKFLCPTDISVDQFQNEAEKIKKATLANEQIANLFKGVYLPVVIPHNVAGITDVGTLLEAWLEAVGKSYEAEFPDRKFYNHRQGDLADKVKIVKESRHQGLLEKIKQGPVFGWYCPIPLQGFSVHAQREQITGLPNNLILSGLDAIIAQIMYPDILAKDSSTPGYDLSAFSWESSGYSLFFGASGDGLGFDYGGDLGYALDCFSGGVLVW